LDTSSSFSSFKEPKQDVQLVRQGLLRTVEACLWGPPQEYRLLGEMLHDISSVQIFLAIFGDPLDKAGRNALPR
jgi:hypothetical protein